MGFEDETIIGRVEDVIFAHGASIFRWDAIFTKDGLTFIKMAGGNRMNVFLIGPLVEVLMGPAFAKKKRLKMNGMNISEMFRDDKDNFRLTKEELRDIEVERGNALVRSRVFLNRDGKKMKFGFSKKEDVNAFLSLLEKVKTV